MAFFSKVRGLLQHQITNNIGREVSASTPFIFQSIRCMSSKVFVGGLSYQTSQETLQQTFGKYGEVYEARIILDRETGNSRGFGFVTFESTEAANSAIMALDGQELDGRRLKVNHAHDRGQGQGYGGGGGYSNSGGGGGYGNFGGGNYQGGGYGNYGGNNQGGGYGNYGGGGNKQGGGYDNYQGGGSYQGGGGFENFGGNNQGSGGYNYSAQGDQGSFSNNPVGDGGFSTTGATGGGGGFGGNLDSGVNFANTNAFDGGANNPNFGVAAGNDNYNGSNFTSSGFENNNGLSSEGGQQFNNDVNSNVAYGDEAADGYQERRAS